MHRFVGLTGCGALLVFAALCLLALAVAALDAPFLALMR